MAVTVESKVQHSEFITEMLAQQNAWEKATPEAKTWVKRGGLYHCGNCGRVPTCIDIRDLKECPYCDTPKMFYDAPNGERIRMWTSEELEERRREIT